MRVKLDNKNHYLNSDPYCYWVTVEVTAESGKVYDRLVGGYYANAIDCINGFVDLKVRSSNANDIVELFQEVEQLKKQIKTWKPKVERERGKKND